MVFSSVIFIFCFLPIVLGGYYLLRSQRLKNVWLLVLSLIFYAWGEPRLIVVMIVSMFVNYGTGLYLERCRNPRRAKSVLCLGILANLSLIGYYKYAGFLVGNYNLAAEMLGLPPMRPVSVLLPLGISFYTFQGISYLVDVFKRETKAARNPLHLMLYIAMFPHQLAGPIVRFRDIAEQLKHRQVTTEGFRAGLMRFVVGLGKKVLLANIVAGAADAIFAQPAAELTLAVAWLGVICYTLQIYLDFSAYSDMAIGMAAMFGITFAENFNYPYISQSITEFWRRWHMTLSGWFRDYVYIPLGGNRLGKWRTYFNLGMVFLLCGLWHGASWTFIVWGIYHGMFLILERCGLGKLLESLGAVLRHVYTLLVVMVGWVFFRAESFGQAMAFLKAMTGQGASQSIVYSLDVYFDVALLIVMIAGTAVCVPWGLPRLPAGTETFAAPRLLPLRIALTGMGRMAVLATLLMVCSIRIVAGTHNPFIYFRF